MKLLGISKRGDVYLRTLLIHGARSVITHAKERPVWLEKLLCAPAAECGGGGAGQQDGAHDLGAAGA